MGNTLKAIQIDWKSALQERLQDQVAAVAYLLRNELALKPLHIKGDAASSLSQQWLRHCSYYMFKVLSPGERATLYCYSTQTYSVINDFLRGGSEYETEFSIPDVSATEPDEWQGTAFDALEHLPEVQPFAKELAKIQEEEKYLAWRAGWVAWLKSQPKGWMAEAIQKRLNDTMFQTTCLFIHQARIMGVFTLDAWKTLAPTLRAADWKRILEQFVADMGHIFKRVPALPAPLTVYRGTREPAPKRRAGYISTSLSKAVAEEFVDEDTKCCLQTIDLPAGARVLPMFMITRYEAELEILLE